MTSISYIMPTKEAIDDAVAEFMGERIGNINKYEVSGTYGMNPRMGTFFGKIAIDKHGKFVGRVIDRDFMNVYKIMTGGLQYIDNTMTMNFVKRSLNNNRLHAVYHHLEQLDNGLRTNDERDINFDKFRGTYNGNWFLNKNKCNSNHKLDEKLHKRQLDDRQPHEISIITTDLEMNISSVTLRKVDKTRTA